jgi:hypothetical protein
VIDFAGQVGLPERDPAGAGRAARGLPPRQPGVHRDAPQLDRRRRLRTGLHRFGEGWLAQPGSEPTADDIAAHLGEVSATEPFEVPASIVDEVLGISKRLGVTL